ncbi:TM2 domain-containing protein [Anaerococcus sp. AGMB00486]|uniref:TM2 domain-containing protein n=2 Tax=Anaerococcus TaxID=165779 RepID=A0ABX2N9A4_9FIRM|nr:MULTISPECIES: NINE protein [Anaerococcus]MDY3005867.1 NINE protein [Anaerococcus porci]MSS77607.1 TM2 domain-containing protein [Anaerococcus porci]NVF11280.1 TM2 domain-containing protein [Anaerococcus faecalis]
MGEIIKIEADKVVVGLEDGSVIRIDLDDVNFVPNIGDKVKVFNDGNHNYIRKAKEKSEYESYKTVDEKEYYRNDLDKSSVTNIYINQENKNIPYGKYPVNKWIYAILALFLGGFGAHKFYSRKFGKGIIYLIFICTGIPTIISFFEFIIALTKTPDENGYIYM